MPRKSHRCRAARYYAAARRKESKRSQPDRVLLEEIRRIHQETKEAYGATKTWWALKQCDQVSGNHGVGGAQGADQRAAQAEVRIAPQGSKPHPRPPKPLPPAFQ